MKLSCVSLCFFYSHCRHCRSAPFCSVYENQDKLKRVDFVKYIYIRAMLELFCSFAGMCVFMSFGAVTVICESVEKVK